MSWKVRRYKESIFKDERGYIWTSWKNNKKKYFNLNFKHDKFALSKKNVLRGFHWDKKTWKMISSTYGKIFLAVVNLQQNDKDYFKTKTYILDAKKNNLQILIPPYYANATVCLSDECVLHYKLAYPGNYNDAKQQNSIKWNDDRINVKWPKLSKIILSRRDKGEV